MSQPIAIHSVSDYYPNILRMISLVIISLEDSPLGAHQFGLTSVLWTSIPTNFEAPKL